MRDEKYSSVGKFKEYKHLIILPCARRQSPRETWSIQVSKKLVFVVKLQQNHCKKERKKKWATIFDTLTGYIGEIPQLQRTPQLLLLKTNRHWWHVCKNVSADIGIVQAGRHVDEIWLLARRSKHRDSTFVRPSLQEQNTSSVSPVRYLLSLSTSGRRSASRTISLNHLLGIHKI